MSLRRIAILFWKETFQGPKNFIFFFAIVVPVVFSLVISLLVGRLFSGQPSLGIADEGSSRLVALLEDVDALALARYESADALRDDVDSGRLDAGIVLPANVDDNLRAGAVTDFTVYLWGESLLRDRAIIGSSIAFALREVAGAPESPVTIVTTTLGNGDSVPWDQRLMPLVILFAIIIGGVMIPATSLIEEKTKRTLGAVTVTPVTYGEVLVAKGLLGALLSLVMGLVTLLINRLLGDDLLPLLVTLALSAALSAIFGLLLGIFIKDINSLFATIKAIGILLYAPAFVYLAPEFIPQWVGQLFPTYYMLNPVITLTQNGGAWADITTDVGILVLLNVALIAVVAVVLRRREPQAALA